MPAQNPIIRDQFSADPTARVFNNKVYVYPSHDIVPPDGQRQDWFCMEDYHVFSSENLTDWTDHGMIVTQNKVPWVRPDSYSMWAPDCIERNGKYYFYFPSAPKGGYIRAFFADWQHTASWVKTDRRCSTSMRRISRQCSMPALMRYTTDSGPGSSLTKNTKRSLNGPAYQILRRLDHELS